MQDFDQESKAAAGRPRVLDGARQAGAPAVLGEDGKPWWESYFGPDSLRMYADKDRASGEAEARAVLAAMALRSGARLLDVGCGNGRHALALARRGYAVTGLDRSAFLLEIARKARDAEGLRLDLIQGDMRSLPPEGLAPVEGVISMFTSFGYFNDAENEQVARGMAACLVRGGRLLLDLNSRDSLVAVSGQKTWTQLADGYLLDEFHYDADRKRFHGTRILVGAGGERRYPFDQRVYTEPEIRALLHRVGLRVLAVYGSLDRSPFNARSPRMVVLAEKP